MFVPIFVGSLIFVEIILMAIMLVHQVKFFEIYKKEKKPSYPITYIDTYQYMRKHGYDPKVGTDTVLYVIRRKLLMQRYPNNKELDRMVIRLHVLQAIFIVLAVGATVILIQYMSHHPEPST